MVGRRKVHMLSIWETANQPMDNWDLGFDFCVWFFEIETISFPIDTWILFIQFLVLFDWIESHSEKWEVFQKESFFQTWDKTRKIDRFSIRLQVETMQSLNYQLQKLSWKLIPPKEKLSFLWPKIQSMDYYCGGEFIVDFHRIVRNGKRQFRRKLEMTHQSVCVSFCQPAVHSKNGRWKHIWVNGRCVAKKYKVNGAWFSTSQWTAASKSIRIRASQK